MVSMVILPNVTNNVGVTRMCFTHSCIANLKNVYTSGRWQYHVGTDNILFIVSRGRSVDFYEVTKNVCCRNSLSKSLAVFIVQE